MKIVFYISLLFCLVACKKPDVVTKPVIEEPKKPWGIREFSVKGVPKENIRFVALGSNNPDRVVIDLPEHYEYKDKLFLSLKLPEGFILKNYFQERLATDDLAVQFDGKDIWLFLEDTLTHSYGEFYVYVNPTVPILYTPNGKDFTCEIDGENKYIFLSVENWGTDETINKADSMVYFNTALIKNRTTGLITKGSCGYTTTNESNQLFVALPPTLLAGEYELTLIRDDRSIVIPDHVVVKYGLPLMKSADVVSVDAFLDSGNVVKYHGYNLLSGHSYKLRLSNDFIGTKTFDLQPKNPFTLEARLPSSLEAGTYESAIFIDDRIMEYTNTLTDKNFVFIRKNPHQPALALLSQWSKKFDNSSGVDLFKPSTNFNRSEDILAFRIFNKPYSNSIVKESKLLLENKLTGAAYELKQTGNTLGILPYPLYKLTSNIPSAPYKVRLSILFETETEAHISGPYYKIITIE